MKQEFKKQTITRLKRACGQLEAVVKMIEKDAYCMDTMQQLLAVIGALKKIPPMILEQHLFSCAGSKLLSKDEKVRKKAVKEIVQACTLSNK